MSRSPKKKRKAGSLACGLRTGAFCAEMLTTAGSATRAAALNPPGLEADAAGACTTVTCAGSSEPLRNHSGLSVPNTNSTATATVTAWEKISQVLRIA